MESGVSVRQGLLQRRLDLRLAGLGRLKPPLGGSRPLHRKHFRRPRIGRLRRPVLGLAADGLQLALELLHLGVLHLEKTRLAARHLLQTLQNKKQAC